jgi:hypothetical protein
MFSLGLSSILLSAWSQLFCILRGPMCIAAVVGLFTTGWVLWSSYSWDSREGSFYVTVLSTLKILWQH